MNNKRMIPALIVAGFLLIDSNPLLTLGSLLQTILMVIKQHWVITLIILGVFAINQIENTMPHKRG